MRTLQAVLEGLREVFAHKARSGIAVLALVCGVASLLATLALTDGAAAAERRFLIDWGGVEKLYIIDKPLPPAQEKRRGISPGKTLRDIEAIEKSVSLAKFSAPHTEVAPKPVVTCGKKQLFGPFVFSTTPRMHDIDKFVVEKGRPLTQLDLDRRMRVCVLGFEAAEALGLKDGIGQSILVSGVKFQVVGICKKAEIWYKNKAVLLPVTTVQRLFYTAATETEPERNDNLMFQRIAVQVADLDYMDAAVDQVRAVLHVTHRGLEDVGFNTLEDWSEALEGRVAATKLTGSLTATVSLLVGGIGITNVMLASVRQRMREIGIRRAVGATSIDIFLQIVTETVVLSFIGGLIGLGAGVGLINFLSSGIEEVAAPIITAGSCLLSFCSALAVGIVSGMYPAFRGARVSPNEALRYE